MKSIESLTETERLKLDLSQARLREEALRYAHDPNEWKNPYYLYTASHEFGNVLRELGLDEYWVNKIVVPDGPAASKL